MGLEYAKIQVVVTLYNKYINWLCNIRPLIYTQVINAESFLM